MSVRDAERAVDRPLRCHNCGDPIDPDSAVMGRFCNRWCQREYAGIEIEDERED